MPDHEHRRISIPPKQAVSAVVGFIKGKSAIHLARVYGERRGNFVGQSFWREGILCRRWVGTKRRSANPSAPKRRKTSDSISSTSGTDRPPLGGTRTAGPR